MEPPKVTGLPVNELTVQQVKWIIREAQFSGFDAIPGVEENLEELRIIVTLLENGRKARGR